MHHVAFEVPDIRAEMDRLKAEGFQLLQDEPTRGADNKWVCFIHPKSANGVLIELCQSIPSTSITESDGLEL
jgi:methylmalonyl-CoA/ethylmalonyl-CoA epimerase